MPENRDDSTVTILDGAMGSLLSDRGADTTLPLWSARALLDSPDLVRSIHALYIRAGAQVITTNTFRTHRRSLDKAGLGDRAAELTQLAVTLCREAIANAAPPDRPVRTAGSISPLEDCYSPDLAPDFGTASREHGEMVTHLCAAGVDLLLIETMPTWDEASAAITAAQGMAGAHKTPIWLSLHTREPGVLLSGEELTTCLARLVSWPEALLINCVPVERALDEVRFLRRVVPTDIPIGIYANIGSVNETKGWSTSDAVSPEQYAAHARRWIEAGATIVGGCCGTNPRYIAALTEMLAHEDHLRP